jgi:hypothetical protein
MVLKKPDASVVTEDGLTVPRDGSLSDKLTVTPPAGLPFTNTWPDRVDVLLPVLEVHTDDGFAIKLLIDAS